LESGLSCSVENPTDVALVANRVLRHGADYSESRVENISKYKSPEQLEHQRRAFWVVYLIEKFIIPYW
jgi:hypothetical protein